MPLRAAGPATAGGHGGIGRRKRLKIACPVMDVGVQVPLPPLMMIAKS